MAGLAKATEQSLGQRMGLRMEQWLREPFYAGFFLLVILVTLFLGQPLFTDRPLLAADLLFQLDPLWQPLAPSGYSAPANQVLSDQVFEFYPWQHFIRAELADGRLPLWNPTVNSGHPLLANAQSAPFDPFNLIALLWPLHKSFVVVAFLRLLCAGTFMLLLALVLGLSRFAAYLAMVVFTFAMPQVVWLLYPKASVLVWLPALLYFSLRVIRTGRWRAVAMLGLVMAAQLVGGHPETALYSALLWLLFSGYWLWLEARVGGQGSIRRTLLQLAMAGLLGLGLSAIQWLPVAEALLQSEILAARSQGALTWQTVLWQWQQWLAALTLLMPDFFGNPRHQDYWFPYSNYTEQTLYVGVLPLALALLVYFAKDKFVQGNGRQVAFFATLAVVSLGLALRLPGFPLLAELPGLSVTNVARLRSIYMLAVALLAGYALDYVRQSLLEDKQAQPRYLTWLNRILVGLGIVAAAIALSAYGVVTRFQTQLVEMGRAQATAAQGNPFFFRTPAEYMTLAQVRVTQMLASFHPANWTMYVPLILALIMVVVSLIAWRMIRQSQRRAQVLSAAIVMLTVGELWLVGPDYNPTIAPENVYPMPPLVESLLRDDSPRPSAPYRVMGLDLALVPNTSMIFGVEDIRGYDPIAPRRYMALMSRLSGAVRVGHHLLFTQADAPLLDFLNVRYAFVADGARDALGARWMPVQEGDGVTLYANQDAMPRTFMVYRSQLTDTPDASLAMTLDPNFDFRHEVVLEGVDAPLLQGAHDPAPVVEILDAVPGRMTVAVTTAQPGLLVMSDPYTPGWVATVDGNEAEIFIANHAFRAVNVPQGTHTLTFTYRPSSISIGAWSSGISSVVVIVLLLMRGKRPKRRRRNA